MTPGSGVAVSTASVRGVTSHGMLCSAFDIGWTGVADGVAAEMPASAEVGAACPARQPPAVRCGGSASSSGHAAESLCAGSVR